MSEITRDGKHPATPAAGPYGHPFHPALVTLPIGALILSVLFDVASFFVDDPGTFRHMSFWCMVVGIAGALFAAPFGLMDLLAIPRRTKAFATGVTHMVLNLVVVAMFAINALMRRGGVFENEAIGAGPFILSLIAILMLAVSGWLGGELAYRFGVRVADEGTQSEGFTTDARQVTTDRRGQTSSRRSIPGTS